MITAIPVAIRRDAPVCKEHGMDFKGLVDQAKGVFQKRGGAQAAKEDAAELKDVAQSDASAAHKTEDAIEAMREPGTNPPNTTTP